MNNRKYFWIVLTVLFLSGVAVTGAYMLKRQINIKRGQELYQELSAQSESSVQQEISTQEAASDGEKETETLSYDEKRQLLEKTYGIEIPEKTLDFEALKTDVNQDIYAWIYVPDTVIDYPVFQHPLDDAYYLTHNPDGSAGYPGCIYTESRNSKDFTDRHTVLYGHNMLDGTMFAGLHQYEDSQFFEEHPYFFIYTEDTILICQVFRAYAYTDTHLLRGFDTGTDIGYQNYLLEIKEYRSMTSNADEELLSSLSVTDRIVTLATCVNNNDKQRYLVQGVLLNED